MTPRADRIDWVRTGFLAGMTKEEIHDCSKIDPWFLAQLETLIRHEQRIVELGRKGLTAFTAAEMLTTKKFGYSDRQIAAACAGKVTEWDVRAYRKQLGVKPVYKRVDTCAAEFQSFTPYLYSTYDGTEDETVLDAKKKRVVVLGGGPNRIGQGIEFDYCCVHEIGRAHV